MSLLSLSVQTESDEWQRIGLAWLTSWSMQRHFYSRKLLVRLQLLWCIHDCTVFCFSALLPLLWSTLWQTSVKCAIKIKFYLLYFYFLLMQLFTTGCWMQMQSLGNNWFFLLVKGNSLSFIYSSATGPKIEAFPYARDGKNNLYECLFTQVRVGNTHRDNHSHLRPI